jgi:hypothetical protein
MTKPVAALAAACMLAFPLVARAQGADSARVQAGAHYAAGPFKRLLFGGNYRELWTQPFAVVVFDPEHFAGGVRVEKEGGGLSTESLRMLGRDGHEYVFRSVDKNVTPGMHPDLRGTVVQGVVQDLVSGKHPASALVAAPLLETAGVLHATPVLVRMPDHPFLGELREQFRGRLGTLEERPTDGFAGSPDVKGSDDVRKKIEDGPGDRVDAHAFLTARLMDVLLGDWDRHWDQWRWARVDEAGGHRWLPIPRDRDNAFNGNGGVLVRMMAGMTPILVRYRPKYEHAYHYHAHPAELDRLLLAGLDRAAWDSTARALRARLTDRDIDAAVRRMPPEYFALGGEALAATLKARRDALPEEALAMYALMAREVEMHATDQREIADIVRQDDGSVRVTVRPRAGGAPLFERTLRPGETREVRVFLHGGDDQARVSGAGEGAILVRVIGGGGDDELANQAPSHGHATVFYDDRGHNQVSTGSGGRLDERAWEPPRPTSLLGNAPPVRDWGTSSTLTSIYANWELNIGPVVGVGPAWKRYGFRRVPHAEQISLQGLWAPFEHNGVGARLHYDRQITNRPRRVWLDARVSNFETVRFNGFGNQSPRDPDRDLYEVDQTQARLQAALELRPTPALTLFAGPAARWTNPGEVAAPGAALGSQGFWQAGGAGGARLELRDSVGYPRHGGRAQLLASGYGTDLGGAFGRVEGEAEAYASLPGGHSPVLALRAGAARALGDYPFQESAFVGGPMNLRGFAYQRFRGDAALYGSAELRQRLAYLNLGVARTHLGVFALADAGRVYLDGDSPGGWHTGVGGGLSFQTLAKTFSLAYARGEQNGVYVAFGMPY